LDIALKSVSSCVPKGRITNEDAIAWFIQNNKENLDDGKMEFIRYSFGKKLDFLGNRTRSACLDGENYINLVMHSAERAVETSGIPTEEIDGIIGTGMTNPVREPTLAAVIAHGFGLDKGIYFDVNDTCNSFMKCLTIASLLLQCGRCRNVLITACEAPFEMPHAFQENLKLENMDYLDNRFSNLLLGTGAGSIILGTGDSNRKLLRIREKNQVVNWDASVITVADTAFPENRYKKDSILGFWTDARNISSEWRRGIVSFTRETMGAWQMDIKAADKVFIHQLGDNVTFAVLRELGLDKAKAPVNTYNEIGNLASANIPVLVDRAQNTGLLEKGDSLLWLSGGGGFSYSVAHVAW